MNLKSTEWSDTLYRSLEPYLKPSVYMRDWLVNTEEYKLMTEYLTMLENGLDPEVDSDESDETSTEYIFSACFIGFIRINFGVETIFKHCQVFCH